MITILLLILCGLVLLVDRLGAFPGIGQGLQKLAAVLIPFEVVIGIVATDAVLTGADRIAANGDVANKVGTYALAVLAHHHGAPFYSVAPTTSFDTACPDGARISIEHRGADEVAVPFGVRVAPAASAVFNPAFDVTPAALVTGYVTERGIVHPPFEV